MEEGIDARWYYRGECLSLKLACFGEERGMVRERKLDPILGD